MRIKTTQETRTVTVNVNKYIAFDGKEFDNEKDCDNYERIKNGTRIICPQCQGKGGWEGEFVPAYDNYDIGHVDGHRKWESCSKCHGKGYLDKKVTWI